jgi:hypothetical protein
MTILQIKETRRKTESITLDLGKYASRLFRMLDWIVISQLTVMSAN